MGIKVLLLLLLLIVKTMTINIKTANAFIIQEFLHLPTHFKIPKYFPIRKNYFWLLMDMA